MHVMALLVGHDHDNVRRLGHTPGTVAATRSRHFGRRCFRRFFSSQRRRAACRLRNDNHGTRLEETAARGLLAALIAIHSFLLY